MSDSLVVDPILSLNIITAKIGYFVDWVINVRFWIIIFKLASLDGILNSFDIVAMLDLITLTSQD